MQSGRIPAYPQPSETVSGVSETQDPSAEPAAAAPDQQQLQQQLQQDQQPEYGVTSQPQPADAQVGMTVVAGGASGEKRI